MPYTLSDAEIFDLLHILSGSGSQTPSSQDILYQNLYNSLYSTPQPSVALTPPPLTPPFLSPPLETFNNGNYYGQSQQDSSKAAELEGQRNNDYQESLDCTSTCGAAVVPDHATDIYYANQESPTQVQLPSFDTLVTASDLYYNQSAQIFEYTINSGLTLDSRYLVAQGDGGGGGPPPIPRGNPAGHNWTPECSRGSEERRAVRALMQVHVVGGGGPIHEAGILEIEDELERMDDELERMGSDDDAIGQSCGPMHEDTISLSRPISERQALHRDARALLQKLADVCQDILFENQSSGGQYTDAVLLLTRAFSGDNPIWKVEDMFFDESLDALSQRVTISEDVVSSAKFFSYITLLHFRTRFESEYHCLHKPHVSEDITRTKWLRKATVYCILAGAGTIYLLAITACAEVNTLIRTLPADQALHLGILLRCPTSDPLGELVTTLIIPAIAVLRSKFDIKFSTMFSPSILKESPKEVWSSDIVASDKVFDNISYNAFVKERDWNAWHPCALNLAYHAPKRAIDTDLCQTFLQRWLPSVSGDMSEPPSSPTQVPTQYESSPPCSSPIPFQDMVTFSSSSHNMAIDEDDETFLLEVIPTISTNFDPLQNVKYLPGKNATDEEIVAFTENERLKAHQAVVANDRDDLKIKLQNQLKSGKKTKNSYIRIPMEILQNEPLRINDKNGDFLAIINPRMPQDMRDDSIRSFKVVFGGAFQDVNSSSDLLFPALHFAKYNRYSTEFVSQDDEDMENLMDPAAYRRAGKRKVNTSTMIPRSSEDIHEYPGVLDVLSSSMQHVFHWHCDQLQSLLPKEFHILRQFTGSLPAQDRPAAFPFSSLVVNLNNACRIHRDWQDEELCLVHIVSDCEDGCLVIVEAGLVIPLRNGDTIYFRSSRLSHLNLHFRGFRASIVLHSDRHGRRWENRNGWSHNKYFRSAAHPQS